MNVKNIRLRKRGMQIVMSPLESSIIDILWKGGPFRVRDIHHILKKKKHVALTSVAVSLDRLHTRGAVKRTVKTGRGGPHYIYAPSSTRNEFEKRLLDSAVNKLIDSFGNSAVSYFNERFGKRGKG